MVVPRYSTRGLVAVFLIRRLISYGFLYVVLRVLGLDVYQQGGWPYIALMLLAWYLINIGDLVRALLSNRDLRRALDTNRDPQFLIGEWHKRDAKFHRFLSIPLALVGVAIVAGVMDLPALEVPRWAGLFVFGIAAAFALSPRIFVEKRTIESMVTHVLPPGFTERE